MPKSRIMLGAFLLSIFVATGLASAWGSEDPLPEMEGGAICGAWEPRGGPGDGFRRLCVDGSLSWYEYQ